MLYFKTFYGKKTEFLQNITKRKTLKQPQIYKYIHIYMMINAHYIILKNVIHVDIK